MSDNPGSSSEAESNARHAAAATIADYDRVAARYQLGTADHDVSQNIDALLGAIEGEGPYRILDFGCGPGRDLKSFTTLGHEAIGLDGSEAVAQLARTASDCQVWVQDFLALDLPAEHFDGIFANASMFHIPSLELPRVLGALAKTLRPRGVLFSSNPRGQNQEGWNGERYGAYYDLETWRRFVTNAGFEEIDHYYRPPGLPRNQQPWLASVWRRIG